MIKKIFLFVLFISPYFLVAQESIDWISAEATIKNIETKRSGRKARDMATVEFKQENGEIITTYVELFRIPLIGSLQSVGDQITIYYDKNNPASAKTNSGKFISQYGIYILIGLGIIFSLKNVAKAQSYKQKS